MGLFDGQIKSFATKMVTALEEQAVYRFSMYQGDTSKNTYLSVCIVLQDIAVILKKVAELE